MHKNLFNGHPPASHRYFFFKNSNGTSLSLSPLFLFFVLDMNPNSFSFSVGTIFDSLTTLALPGKKCCWPFLVWLRVTTSQGREAMSLFRQVGCVKVKIINR